MYARKPIYSHAEESFNAASHAFGFALSCLALVLLLLRALPHGNGLYVVSFIAFGISLVLLYGASTAYHSARTDNMRRRWRAVDHAAIFLLIAGTYTPFALITLGGTVGWAIFAASWSLAAVGVVLKLFYAGRFRITSTVAYVAMGWMILFAIDPLLDAFAGAGLWWLVAGGVTYTVGALIYAIPGLPWGHPVFHIFVLGGSTCHFVAVYGYVLPAI
ncbi:MAG: hemolysin III family protein [Pseudomonadota bacterium]